jgi:hypothetical protein
MVQATIIIMETILSPKNHDPAARGPKKNQVFDPTMSCIIRELPFS